MNLEDVKVYTVDEVAYALRVASETVYRMIKRGDLHAIKVGGVYRIPEQTVADLLKPRIEKEVDDALHGESEGNSDPGWPETESLW